MIARNLIAASVLCIASSLAIADTVTFDFESASYGPGPFTLTSGGITITFSRPAGLTMENLSPFAFLGVPGGWGSHSLSTFADPGSDTYLELTISAPGKFIESIGWEMGDMPGSDGDVLTVSSLAGGMPLSRVLALDTSSFLHSVILLGGSPFLQRAVPIDQELFPTVLIKAGSPGAPNSVYFDNFTITFWDDVQFFAGTDVPESGFGGDPSSTSGTSGQFSEPVPEPGTLLLVLAGLGLAASRHVLVRRRQRA